MGKENETGVRAVPRAPGPAVAARLYWVAAGTRKVTGGVEVCGNKIVDAPPVWKNWIGRSFSTFKAYYNAEVKELVYCARCTESSGSKVSAVRHADGTCPRAR
jgi:hypothetical protein